MGFRINTNVAALDAHNKSTQTNRALDKSLGSLASGLRINSAADDSSGLVIADSLRSQANSLGQAVRNANDAIGIIQTADKAIDEQVKILDTIKTKAIQAASDGQSTSSREAIQQDVNRLIDSLNNIAQTTSFNGQSLLSGKYTDKEFQVGAYSNQTVKTSISNTEAGEIGNIQQTTDSTTLGNIVPTTAAATQGATTISVATADLNGLGKGDIISFEGSTSTYSVQEVEVSTGTITLSVPLTEDVAKDAKINVTGYANNPAGYVETTTTIAAANTNTFTLNPASDQLQGLAIGDNLTFVNSVGASSTVAITGITTSTGVISTANTTLTIGAAAELKIFTEAGAAVADTSVSSGALALTSTTISSGQLSLTGLGEGDVIRITNGTDTQDFVINGIDKTAGAITLNNAIATAFSVGSTISVQSTAADNTHFATGAFASGGTTITVSDTTLDIRGLAAGDIITLVADDGTTADATISSIATSSGVITFDSAVTLTGGITAGQGGILAIKTSDVLGNSFSSADYVQYTIEGQKVDGVQITDGDGYGTAGTGLGRVAEQINAVSDITGISATATVSAQGTVVAGTIASDITINGVTILASGTTLAAGDSDGKLVDAINATATDTGVRASLVDGQVKLESDGRSAALSGFTSTVGIADGVIVGELNFTSIGSDPVSIVADHYTDANLKTSNSNAATSVELNTTAFTLEDLVSGRVDDNGDGTVDNNDITGLLRTREGATVAIDIVETAINELDSSRAGLGSAQNELLVTVNSISVTQVNVKAAESQIRDVDFASESSNFSRLNILAQSGSYALSQANAIQQNVLRLLQ